MERKISSNKLFTHWKINVLIKIFSCLLNPQKIIRFNKYYETNIWHDIMPPIFNWIRFLQKMLTFIIESLRTIWLQVNSLTIIFKTNIYSTRGAGISDINLEQVCRWASTDPPYKCILEYGKGIPINVYTIIEDNKKCSLLPFRWGSFI